MRAREREARERDARERIAKERIAREKELQNAKEAKEKELQMAKVAKEKELQMAKEAKEKEEREARLKAAKDRAEKLRSERAATEKANSERAQSERAPPTFGVGERINPYSLAPPAAKSTIGTPPRAPQSPDKWHQPTAQSYAGTATDTAYRPYDKPPQAAKHKTSASSFYSTYSDSYAPSESTAQTSPPPSNAGPYTTKDPDKVIIRGAYKFTDTFKHPIQAVRPLEANITDGLIMRITTEGVFLDDDRKREPLRQWDIKAWTMKGVEVSSDNLRAYP
jgi:hypothetical protein